MSDYRLKIAHRCLIPNTEPPFVIIPHLTQHHINHCIDTASLSNLRMGEVMINSGLQIIMGWISVTDVRVTYCDMRTTGWKSHSAEIHNCRLSLKILPYHAQPLGVCFREKRKKIQNPFHSESKVPCVSLAAVHCQVVMTAVPKPVCVVRLCASGHCVHREHSHLQ